MKFWLAQATGQPLISSTGIPRKLNTVQISSNSYDFKKEFELNTLVSASRLKEINVLDVQNKLAINLW